MSLFLLEYIPRGTALGWPPRCLGTIAPSRYQLTWKSVRKQVFRVPTMSQAYSPRAFVGRSLGRWGAWGPELWHQLSHPLSPPATANQGSEGLEEGTCEPLESLRPSWHLCQVTGQKGHKLDWLVANPDSAISIWRMKWLWASVIQESFILGVWLEQDLEGRRGFRSVVRGKLSHWDGIRGMAAFSGCVGVLCWLSPLLHSLFGFPWSVNFPWTTGKFRTLPWKKEWPPAGRRICGVSLLFLVHTDSFLGERVGEAIGHEHNI